MCAFKVKRAGLAEIYPEGMFAGMVGKKAVVVKGGLIF